MQNLIELFSEQKILVVGDSMLDIFHYGRNAPNPESSSIPRLFLDESTYALGGAGNALANVASMGGDSVLYTCVGNDDSGRTLLDLFRKDELKVIPYFDGMTVVKRRINGDNSLGVRLDNDPPNILEPIKDRARTVILGAKNEKNVTGLLLSDYNKGIFKRKDVANDLIEWAHKSGIPSVVCPKPSNFDFFYGANVVCVNMTEAEEILRTKFTHDLFIPIELQGAVEDLRCRNGSDQAVITCGKNGAVYSYRGILNHIHPYYSVSNPHVIGAGDSFAAALTLGVAAESSNAENFLNAVRVANAAGSLAVQKPKTSRVSMKELSDLFGKG